MDFLAHRAPSSVIALIAAAALAVGCDQLPTRQSLAEAPGPAFAKPACPGHPSCKDDGGGDDGGEAGGGDVTAFLTGGATIASSTDPQLMTSVTDDASTLSMNSDQSDERTVDWGFTNTHGAGLSTNTCRTEGDESKSDVTFQELFDLLIAASDADGTGADGGFNMSFDKTADGLSSSNHAIMTGATYKGNRVLIGLPAHGDPPPTATAGTSPETYTYSGGIVRIWYKGGKGKKGQLKLFCANVGDQVTVTVNR